MTPRFDKRQPHGVINPPYHGAMHSQDGAYFDGSGRFLFWEGEQPGADPTQTAGKPRMADAVRRALMPHDPAPALSAEDAATLETAGNVLPGLLEAIAAMDATEQAALLAVLKETAGEDAPAAEEDPASDDKPIPVDLNATRVINIEGEGKVGGAKPVSSDLSGQNIDPMENNLLGQQATGDVDLVAWAKGEKQYQFFRVKAAAKERVPDIIDTNTKTIVDGLVKAGVVAAEDVKR